MESGLLNLELADSDALTFTKGLNAENSFLWPRNHL